MIVNLSLFAGAGWQFFDNNGVPLAGGLLYTYAAGTTTPLTTYTSNIANVANSNPIVLNSAGRLDNEIWLTEGNSYKFILKDSNNVLIGTYDNIFGANDQTALTTFEATLANSSNVALGDNLVGFRQSNVNGVLAGAVGKTVHQKFQEYISVLDFGADPTGAADSSTAISNAISTGKAVYFPKGTYLCNVSINNKTILFGDGSTASIIKPYSYSSPAFIYTFAAMQSPVYSYWNYHSVVRDLGFQGTGSNTSATGIGFSFGSGSPTSYTTNAELANNVQFYNCQFSNLNKGVQFPFGNIGSAFYSCGFQNNYYGVYNISNLVANTMHAGCKYFYNGEMSGNVCALYCYGALGGSIMFRDTIIETNSMGMYFNNIGEAYNAPITFDGCWIEANGQVENAGSTVTIDKWTGYSLSTQTITANTFVFDGTTGQYTISNSWFVDFAVLGTNIVITAQTCHTEKTPSNGGAPITAISNTSSVVFNNPATNYGIPLAKGLKVLNYPTLASCNVSPGASAATGRSWLTKPRTNLVSNYGFTKQAVEYFTSSITTVGSIALVGAVISDGVIFNTCNQFTATAAAFPSGSHAIVSSTVTSMSDGYWYVVTFDAKQNTGLVIFNVWNEGTGMIATVATCPSLGDWYSFGMMAYCDSGGPYSSVGLDMASTGVDSQWEVSAYQINKFSSLSDAQAFLDGGVYTL